jgi:hypothetical protein
MALVFPSINSDARYIQGGVGLLFVAPYAANGADGSPITFLGPTEGGIEFDQKRDFHVIEVDEFLSGIGAFPMKEEFGFKAVFAETTLANIQALLFNFGNTLTGGQRASASGSLTIGEDKSRNYRQIIYKGPATPAYGSSVNRIYQMFQCVPTSIGPIKYTKGKEGTIAVTFRALADPTAVLASAPAVGKILEQ